MAEEVLEQKKEEVVPPQPEKPKTKRELRKEKKYAKIRQRLILGPDIKYRGPLSYRYLRIIAWISIAVSQILVLNSIASVIGGSFLNYGASQVISIVGDLSLPLFLVAAFGTIFNRKNRYSPVLITYGCGFLALGIGFVIFYERYVSSIFEMMGVAHEDLAILAGMYVGSKFQINVFADLFALAVFNLFINYTPQHKMFRKRVGILGYSIAEMKASRKF